MRKKITLILTVLILPGIIIFSGCGKKEKKLTIEEKKNIQALYNELKTVKLKNCTIKRFGGPHDGGYLMCENLLKDVQVAYSYGIAGRDIWGCDISKKLKVSVHQYDCFDNKRPVCDGAKFHFYDECLGDKFEKIEDKEKIEGKEAKEVRVFDSLTSQIEKNKDKGKKLLVKMDVEGAEWDSLLTTSDKVLNNIDQFVGEFHEAGKAKQKYVEVIKKLKKTFYLVNVHYNNHVCDKKINPLQGHAFEVLFVNKRLGVVDKTVPNPPLSGPLDTPSNPARKDCQEPHK
ncbi:MAG: hypothetical protein GY754_28085 [bacterium]|nr:hypothetical protein [bacterium]